jgi:DNA-binding NarL/FixJ family response regulator
VNVVIVDDHPVMRQGLRVLLPQQDPAIVIVGEASTAREAVCAVESSVPDLVVMGLVMSDASGVATIRDLRKRGSKSRILVYSALSLPAVVISALSAGADGYVLKTDSLEELRFAVARIGLGHGYLSPSLAEQLGPAPLDGAEPVLSQREREIFELILRDSGHTSFATHRRAHARAAINCLARSRVRRRRR